MKTITRKNSIIDGNEHMEELFRLKKFPVHMGITAQNERLYGTSFQVYSPEVLEKQNAPIIILRGRTHNGEIREEILKMNAMAEIWEE